MIVVYKVTVNYIACIASDQNFIDFILSFVKECLLLKKLYKVIKALHYYHVLEEEANVITETALFN